ncbi:MAG TPA: B12-binding domain-containing radical SAM protein, partial [Clostridia bacterium]|nr:B12-binding domain-containing radical SAM protein [Clostridia bacterium]
INDDMDRVIGQIYGHRPNIVALSCYIWNIKEILFIVETLKKVMPGCFIVLGGPEVSFDSPSIMEKNPDVDAIVKGEGEVTVPLLLERLMSGQSLKGLDGLTFREVDSIIENGDRALIKDLDSIPFPYAEGFGDLDNRIIYYETTRGCPFECQYCLSSTSQGVRFLSLERIKKDVRAFIDAKIPQVKLVDRTFNCNPKRARDIFKIIMDMGGDTNFHFEISGDLLDEETIELLKDAPPGLFQFEIGVQSTREGTLDAIRRKTDFLELTKWVEKLKDGRNIHLHLDLIAGLPEEDYFSFQRSFNDVYGLKPDRLQLGFLKLLKGSGLRNDAANWDYKYSSQPPYEVLENRDLTYEEILKLKGVENLVEKYYNTHRFHHSLDYLGKVLGGDYYSLYNRFSDYWLERGYTGLSHKLIRLYEFLIEFGLALEGVDTDLFKDLVKLDYVSEQRPSRYPKGIEVDLSQEDRTTIRNFYNDKDNIAKYLPDMIGYTPAQISRMAHIEFFKDSVILFDYNIPNKLFEKSRRIEIQMPSS